MVSDTATTQNLIDAAEENFKSHNPEEALRLANMAKQLNPLFNGYGIVDRFIAAYGVHAAAARKNSNGDINWYAVLGIDAATVLGIDAANIEIIKNSTYKKLALLVHPDKNTSVAAEGAFKLIVEAQSVLSQPRISLHGAATQPRRPSNGAATYRSRPCPTAQKYVISSARASSGSNSANTSNSRIRPFRIVLS